MIDLLPHIIFKLRCSITSQSTCVKGREETGQQQVSILETDLEAVLSHTTLSNRSQISGWIISPWAGQISHAAQQINRPHPGI